MLLFLQLIMYVVAWVFKNPRPGKLATWVTVSGVACNTAGIILRWVESYQLGFGRAPLSNLYESLVYLLKDRSSGGKHQLLNLFPEAKVLDELTYRMIILGFVFLSIGIITGAVWANSAWGRYWSWDPIETWSLITWFVYATLLHARVMRSWHGKRVAVLSIVGFAAVLFTYFGVNLLPGLNSYGT